MARKARPTAETQAPEALYGDHPLEVMSDEEHGVLAMSDAFAVAYGPAYEVTGQIKAFGFAQKTSNMSGLLLIRQMKETKIYKGMCVSVWEDGGEKLRRIGTFAEYHGPHQLHETARISGRP